MTLLGLSSVLLGAFYWVSTIKWFLDGPGYGGFDMTTASGFDLGWGKGAILLGIGSGILAHSLPVASAVGVGGFLSSMLVKPVLEKVVARKIARSAESTDDDQPPSGFSALVQAERDAAAQESTDE